MICLLYVLFSRLTLIWTSMYNVHFLRYILSCDYAFCYCRQSAPKFASDCFVVVAFSWQMFVICLHHCSYVLICVFCLNNVDLSAGEELFSENWLKHELKSWLHVKQNYFETVLKLFQCFISHITTDGGYVWKINYSNDFKVI